MIKNGIINPELKYNLTLLGHFDSVVICDMGFPIPAESVVVDLSLIRGIPTVRTVLKAVLKEIVVQNVVMMSQAENANPDLFKVTQQVFSRQVLEYLSLDDFRKSAQSAKFFIRTGEDAPCSNILLISASGVVSRVAQFDIPDEELDLL